MLKRLFAALLAIATLLSCSIFANAQNNASESGNIPEEECVDTVTAYPDTSVHFNPNTEEIVLDGADSSLSPQVVLGNDNRTLVSNVTSSPYKAIASLHLIWPNGDESFGTGFMISDKYMLTAAHCTYNANRGGAVDMITAYFGRNGTQYSRAYDAIAWHYCEDYPNNQAVINDWAVIEFASNSVGTYTGHFDVAAVDSSVLTDIVATIAGFPGDKASNNANGPDGTSRKMYEHSMIIGDVYDGMMTYMHDTYAGMSGSPIFTQTGGHGTAYGVHTYGQSNIVNAYNAGRRITSALYNSWLSKGWIS